MSSPRTQTAARTIVADVLGPRMTREIWTANYNKALPVSITNFALSAVLPSVFYMFRFGKRRGKGGFIDTFASDAGTSAERRRKATIECVADTMSQDSRFDGFSTEIGKAILGDMLLCYCLENSKHALGRNESVLRVAPVHYMSSWVDLPPNFAHLRFVPEMVVSMLANQKGDFVQQDAEDSKNWFSVGKGFEKNVLLSAFRQGVSQCGELTSHTSDRFDEEATVGLDQLLMVRVAQKIGSAPDKQRDSSGEKISNQRPIAEKAAQQFSEDIRKFVRAYADPLPRQTFVDLLESCMAIGISTIITSVVEVLFRWAESGFIASKSEQSPTAFFVDCSCGVNRQLRALAEHSFDDFIRRVESVPAILMTLRLLDHGARHDLKVNKLQIATRPYATDWMNLLGELLFERRHESKAILYDMNRKCSQLADSFDELYPECASILCHEEFQPNPVLRLAESLTFLLGRASTQAQFVKLIDSSFSTGTPNGLVLKRSTLRRVGTVGMRKRREIRSLVFTDAVLDYLVHLHVLRGGKRHATRLVSFKGFLEKIRERYGFCVDEAPSGINVSNDLLHLNRGTLERRLRDLGLLVGVNDAEAMKRLRPRFEPRKADDHGMD